MNNRYLRVKKEKHNVSVALVLIVLVLLFAVVSYNKYNLNKKLETYNKKAAILQDQIDAEEIRAEEIAEYGKYTKTKKYAEEIAKEKLGLVNENEIIFKTEN